MISGTAVFSDIHAQVTDIIFNENFGNQIFWDGRASAYPNYSSGAVFSDDSIRIMGVMKSDYPGASGQSLLVFDNNANSDTVILSGINEKYYKTLRLSVGVNALKNAKKSFLASYSTDSKTWTDIDNLKLISGSWPGNNSLSWGYVTFSDTLPVNEKLQLRFVNLVPSEYLYLDDIRISGVFDSASVDYLSGLSVQEGMMTPSFNSNSTSYEVLLPWGTDTIPQLKVTAAATHENISIKKASDIFAKDTDSRTTTITVTSADGSSTRVYSVVFRVDDKKPVFFEDFDTPGADQYIGTADSFEFRLSGLATFLAEDSVKIDPWGSKFISGSGYRRLYISAYDHPDFETLTFMNIDVSQYMEVEVSFAFCWNTGWSGIDKYYPTVEIKMDKGDWIDYGAKYGAAAFPGPLTWAVVRLGGLPEGDTLSIRFSREKNSGSVQEYYIDDLTILGRPLSSDTSLASLSVSEGQLVPSFDPAIAEYHVELEPGIKSSPEVKVEKSDSCASVKIIAATDLNAPDQASRTTIVYIVAEDGTPGQYTVIFDYRARSSEAHLSSLACLSADLVPVFSPDVFEYTVELAAGTYTAPEMTAVKADSSATVSVETAVDVLSGLESERTTTVTVVAEDGITTIRYKILFNVSTTGIPGVTDRAFNLWPNPATDFIGISHERTFDRIEITSLTGKMVMLKTYGPLKNLNLDISGLEKGTYVIRIYDQKELVGIGKMVKK